MIEEEFDEQYDLSEIIFKNNFDKYDIIIEKPKFLSSNINNVKFSLEPKVQQTSKYLNKYENNTEENLLLLDGFIFEIHFSTSLIYKNFIYTNKNLFRHKDTDTNIPFELCIFHKGIFIIKNIDIELKKKLINYNIVFRIKLSTQIFNVKNFSIKWNIGIDETKADIQELKFLCGMTGVSYNDMTQFDEEYLNNNKKIFVQNEKLTQNKFICLNISHIDTNNNWVQNSEKECDIYISTKLLNFFINNYYNCSIVSETYKLFVDIEEQREKTKQNKIKKILFYDKPDAITNIEFLCSTKYIFTNIKLILYTNDKILYYNNDVSFYGENVLTYDLEFQPLISTGDNDNSDISNISGYTISGLNNYMVIPTLNATKTMIEIDYHINNKIDYHNDNNKDLWIKLTRLLFDAPIRNNLVDDTDIIEEYPIVDIIDYIY